MDGADGERPNGAADRTSQDPVANPINIPPGSVPYDTRESSQFQHLIPNDHAQLPPNPPYGLSHPFVAPYPGYMHGVPPGLFSLNMIEDGSDRQPKRRRRTNYRDPENAAKLTTALGILIKQKEENKPQDLKSIATHFGLPYNTLRDNYLKVTTGKLVKDKDDKKPDKSDVPRPKKSSASTKTSTNNSSSSTPRETAPSGANPAAAIPGMGGAHFSPMGLPGGGPAPFGPYAMYHPQMAMHYMPPPMGMHGNMAAHMPAMVNMAQSQQAQAQSMQAGGMHHSLAGGQPPMVHIYSAPIGYQMNPVTGRPMPVFPQAPPGAAGDMHQQMQGQQAAAQPSSGGNNAGAEQASGSATPHTPHTPHMMQQQVYVGGMPPPTAAMSQPMVPMFGPPMFMPPMPEPTAGNPGALPAGGPPSSSTGFSLLLPPGQAYGGAQQGSVNNAPIMGGGSAGSGAVSGASDGPGSAAGSGAGGTHGAAGAPPAPAPASPNSNASFLAAAMSAAYAETSSSSSSSSGATPHAAGGRTGITVTAAAAEPASDNPQQLKKNEQRTDGMASGKGEKHSTSESAGESSTAEDRKEVG